MDRGPLQPRFFRLVSGLLLLVWVAQGADEVESWDLAGDDGGLIGAGEIALWEWGEVTSGPGGGFEGTRAWGTNLTGNYGNDTLESLTLPPRSLVGLSDPAVCWMQWLELEQGDAGWIAWSDGATETVIDPIYGYPAMGGFEGFAGAWEEVCLDLTGAGHLDQIRLVFSADPAVSAAGWYVDELVLLDGDPIGPKLSGLVTLPDTEDMAGPYAVSVTAQDNVSVDSVRIGYRVNGVEQPVRELLLTGEDVWSGVLPGQALTSVVEYWAEATDGANWSRLPPTGSVAFEVALQAPTDLAGPSGRVVATEAELTWSAPSSMHDRQGFRVYRDDLVISEVTATEAIVPLLGEGADVFAVSAVYDVGESPLGEPLSLDSHVPTVVSISPSQAYQGDTLRVDLLGQDLFFVQEDLVVDLGAGVSVEEVEVFDVDTARLLLAVQEGAEAGLRELVVVSGETFLSLPDTFEVVDGAQRPQLVSVEPRALTQGTEVDLIVLASSAFAALPTVTLGEGVLVSDVAWLEDEELRVRVVAELDAPLGFHDLQVDDGQRLWGGLQVQVRDAPPATTSCSILTRSHIGGLGTVLALVMGLRRRRG